MKTVCALLVLGLWCWDAPSLPAQEQPGDSVRVSYAGERLEGRFVGSGPSGWVLRRAMVDLTIPHAAVQRVDVWKRRDAALNILSGAAVMAFGAAINGKGERDIALWAGGGALIGVIDIMIWPGRWKMTYRRYRESP